MSKKIILIVLTFILFIGGTAVFISAKQNPPPSSSKLDTFAKCLSDKGISMFGSYSCSHCQAQKELFGDSFQYINYVECTTQTDKCIQNNIQGYPTWIFKDGTRLEGEQTLDTLSKTSACQLP